MSWPKQWDKKNKNVCGLEKETQIIIFLDHITADVENPKEYEGKLWEQTKEWTGLQQTTISYTRYFSNLTHRLTLVY